MFALTSAPGRDTGLSPFKLVYGRHVRKPLHRDIYSHSAEWGEVLSQQLEVLRDVCRERRLREGVSKEGE